MTWYTIFLVIKTPMPDIATGRDMVTYFENVLGKTYFSGRFFPVFTIFFPPLAKKLQTLIMVLLEGIQYHSLMQAIKILCNSLLEV